MIGNGRSIAMLGALVAMSTAGNSHTVSAGAPTPEIALSALPDFKAKKEKSQYQVSHRSNRGKRKRQTRRRR